MGFFRRRHYGRSRVLAQSAIAYYETTGNRKLLDAAVEIADDLVALFGPGKRMTFQTMRE